MLPRLAVRLARLPLATVPTTSEDLQATDDLGDIDDVTRPRALGRRVPDRHADRLRGHDRVLRRMLLAVQHSVLSVALAATATVAMALRARSVAGLGGRIALVGSAAASGVVAAAALRPGQASRQRHRAADHRTRASARSSCCSRPPARAAAPSPQTMRLIDFFESAVVIAVLPLAVGVMGLYTVLRQL